MSINPNKNSTNDEIYHLCSKCNKEITNQEYVIQFSCGERIYYCKQCPAKLRVRQELNVYFNKISDEENI